MDEKEGLEMELGKKVDIYQLAKIIPIEPVLERINQLPRKYKIFATFVLMTGLRTSEAKEAFNNHDKLCNDGVILGQKYKKGKCSVLSPFTS